MGKKKKVGNPEQIFRQINEELEKKNFSIAASILRKAKFPPQERKKADQLNIDIHYFWALDYFNNKDYLQAITTLRMFVERFKKKIKLPLEKANMLLGLSYFYMNDFVKATTYLETSKNTPATHSFYFYYLLTLIYQKKYTNLAALFTDHEKQLPLLSPDQKEYLAIALAFVQTDYEKANTLLATYAAEEESLVSNITGLRAILANTPYKSEEKFIKPLYKTFLEIELSAAEKQYFAKIPAIKEAVESLENTELQAILAIPLQKLCEDGESLTTTEFEQCMGLPEAYRSFVVYNQVAALYNEDIEETEAYIIAIVKKYAHYFFQIPESIFLFAQIIYWDPDNFTPTFFWKNLETSLDRFVKSFTPNQLNKLSWRIFNCLEDPDYSGKKIHNRRQNKLATTYPQMLALKFWQIIDGIATPDMEVPASALDVFSYPNFQLGSHLAKDKWELFLRDMYPDSSLISILLGRENSFLFGGSIDRDAIESHMTEIYNKLLNKAQTALIDATTKNDVHLKNKVVLDFFKLTHQAINKFEKDRDTLVNEEKKTAFFKAYHQMIVFFEEDQPDSEYLQDYQLLENAPKMNLLAKVIKEYDETATMDLFRKHLAAGESNLIHQALIEELRYGYDIDNELATVLLYLRVLMEEQETELATIVANFGTLYVKRLRLPYVPSYPDSNYFNILEKLTKEKPSPTNILTILTLTEVYMPYLTREVEPFYYNMAEKLLSYFIKAKKKYPTFDFKLKVIQQLQEFVKKAVVERSLKKLGTTLANSEKVFP